MKWRHIRDERPDDNSWIIQLSSWDSTFDPHQIGNLLIGFRKYEQRCSWEQEKDYYEKNGYHLPNFYWIYTNEIDFPCDKEKKCND